VPPARRPAGADHAARLALASSQAALARALVGGAAPPPGFDADRLSLAAAGLRRKRRLAVAAAWPALTRSLGPEAERLVDEHIAATPPGGERDPIADGLALAAALHGTSALDPAACLELVRARARFTTRGGRARVRRAPHVGVVGTRDGRTRFLALAVHLPLLGTRTTLVRL